MIIILYSALGVGKQIKKIKVFGFMELAFWQGSSKIRENFLRVIWEMTH